MLDATHKLAVVTGASTGIGLELARIAAKEKYDLIIAANEPEIEGNLFSAFAVGRTVLA